MNSDSKQKAVLLLADGTFYEGYAIGKIGTSGGEICFNTGMTGYQEIYTDPSYTGQIIVNTTAHIGNYGAHDDEVESSTPKIQGLVVNDFSFKHSRGTATSGLNAYLQLHNIVGIAGLDTRQLVQHIRKKGAMNAIISSEILNREDLSPLLDKVPNMDSLELASTVCTEKAYEISEGAVTVKVAVLDLGIKNSILRHLSTRGCHLKVFPAKTTFDEMKAWGPDGYFISNGPGDPAAMDYAVETADKIIQSDSPVFGICLGSQIMARAVGIGTYKMHHGHRGLNHPVKNLNSGKSEITSQNHGFAVNMEELKASDRAELTHIDLNDDTVEGLQVKGKPAFSVQYHPESSPGPHDSTYLFDDFIELIKHHQS